MNNIHEKMEKEVISLIFREHPDLRILINKARIIKMEERYFIAVYH